MSLSAAALKKMLEMGLSFEQAIELAEVWEAGLAKPLLVTVPTRTKAAERMARYRERRRDLGLEPTFDGSLYVDDLKARDGGACVYCVEAPGAVVDHVHPISQGGVDDLENLVLACHRCNCGKAGRTPDQAGYPIRVESAAAAFANFVRRQREHERTEQRSEHREHEREQVRREPAHVRDITSNLDNSGKITSETNVSSDIPANSELVIAKPTPPARKGWANDENFAKAWDACTPQMRKRSKSREKTWPDWRAASLKAGGVDKLLSALTAYLRDDPDVKRTGGPGFHLWLADGKWDAALTGGSPAVAPKHWTGPPELRGRVVAEMGENFARNYLDPAEWTGTAIAARTRYAAGQLKVLRVMRGVEIVEPQQGQAA